MPWCVNAAVPATPLSENSKGQSYQCVCKKCQRYSREYKIDGYHYLGKIRGA